MIAFSQLPGITNGRYIQFRQDGNVEYLIVDSRKATGQPGTVFFAIKGERHDGHHYIADLYRIGIRQFVVERSVTNPDEFPDANILQVDSTVDALQKIASFHREQFTIPVIGITGSNGKTIVKEWLSQMLSRDRVIVKNPGSYNSQIGVPLSVWQMKSHHQIAIFEAGISQSGEMERLESIIRPSIGIFTNIGSAHDEGFESLEVKIKEKLKLFKHASVMIYCADHEPVDKALRDSGLPTLSWALHRESDYAVSMDGDKVYVIRDGESNMFRIPFTDPASFENCMHCVITMLHLRFGYKRIQQSINSLRSVPMRMEMKEGINQSYLIDDTYNNDLGGLELSLQFLSHQNQKQKKRLILSDILESGLSDHDLISQVKMVVAKNNVAEFVGIGRILQTAAKEFGNSAQFFSSTDDFLAHFDFDTVSNEVVLVKGARTFQFEKIVNRLQRKVHGTIMEVNLGALVHNLNFFRSKLSAETRIMVMVKAFAYGSGSAEVANVLQYHKVDYLGVAYADEGVDLRKNNIGLPIMVMNPSEDSFESLINFNLEPEIYSFKIFGSLLKFLNGRSCRVHLKLDTGMHRLGFESNDLAELIGVLTTHSNIRVASIFSHLAAADEPRHDDFSKSQAKAFLEGAGAISNAIGYRPLMHLLNSSGIIRFQDLRLDMVRLGIGLYGVDPIAERPLDLLPVATLKTVISQIKHIKKGETVGYGRRGVAENDMTVATIAIGYADGFSRRFSRGVGEVLVAGHRAKVMGNVCMDMTMIDITGIPTSEGSEVVIFGPGLPLHEVASRIDTIPYEILTCVSERVKRVFVSDGI